MSQGRDAGDPWRSFRGVMVGILLLEAVVVLLALPVVVVVGPGLTKVTGTYLIGVAALLVVLSAVQRRPWAIWANLAVQLILIGGSVVHAAIGFIGVLFTGVWLLVVYLRAEVRRRQARGLLPGQRRPPENVD